MNSWIDSKYFITSIQSNKKIAPDAYLLSFRRDFDFIAGQVVGLGVTEEIAPRLYSIASGEKDEFVEILYTEKYDGKLTPMLSILKPGDQLMVTTPFGKFTDCPNSPIWIATGTGIAPFISMLKSGKGTNGLLIHGVRTSDYFYFQEFLNNLLKDNYIQCCSSCEQSNFYKGRVTHYLKDQNLTTDKKYYLCGVAEMVVETRDILISKGVNFKNIFSEIYF